MKDITNYIRFFTRLYAKNCKDWDSLTQICSNEDGCVCSKFAEVNAQIRSLISQSYRDKKIYDFDGKLPSEEEVVESHNAEAIQNILWKYLYGDAPFQENLGRKELNAISILDAQYNSGNCVIIHGEQRAYKKGKDGRIPQQLKTQTGKSLLASIIMIDACWRRCFSTNKAITYDWISFLTMRPLLKTRGEEHELISEAKDSDWLVIDDINIIGNDNYDKAQNWTKEQFDGFLMSRITAGLPTVLVCDFDIDKVDLSSNLGYAIDKIANSPETTIIKVEGISGSNKR